MWYNSFYVPQQYLRKRNRASYFGVHYHDADGDWFDHRSFVAQLWLSIQFKRSENRAKQLSAIRFVSAWRAGVNRWQRI